MSIAIPQDAPAMTRRTLGSMVPHPAGIGKIAGAHLGIAAPRMHLAGGGSAATQSNILQTMFQPVNASGSSIPNADVNFVTSPALAIGPGPQQGKAPTPQQEPSAMQDVAQGTQAANGLTGLYNGAGGIGKSISNFFNPLSPGGINNPVNAAGDSIMSPSFAAANGLSSGTAAAAAVPAATDLGASIAASAAPAAIANAGATAGMAGLADTTASGFFSGLGDALAAIFAFEQGGAVPGYAEGGDVSGLTNMLMRREAGETYHASGLLNSAGPGRTDTINTNVPTGAYVIPADVVSGIGEGNTLAGSAVIDRMFGSSPYGIKSPQIRHGRGPVPERAPTPINPDAGPSTVDTGFINSAGKYAKGGADTGKAPVVVAGGEHVLSPQQIIAKFGSLKKGHRTLDEWVVQTRQKIAKEMLKLAPPVGSKVKKK